MRILFSHHTRGLLGIGVADDGTTRAIDWGGVPALVLFNPLQYLLTHPFVEEVWMETVDDDTYSSSRGSGHRERVSSVYSTTSGGGDSSSDRMGDAAVSVVSSSASSLESFEGALVLRRSEFNFDVAYYIREMQREVFDEAGVVPPPVEYFRNTLHGY